MKNIIAVDIGGTNSRFAHFTVEDSGSLSCVDRVELKTANASSLDDLIDRALGLKSIPAGVSWDIVVLAVPGAVKENTCASLANVSWDVDVSGLRARLAGSYGAESEAARIAANSGSGTNNLPMRRLGKRL